MSIDTFANLADDYEKNSPERDYDIGGYDYLESPMFNYLPLSNLDKNTLLGIKTRKEIIVAVIDSGIDCLNPFFKDRIWVPAVLKRYSCGINVVKGENISDMTDHLNHGTSVASLILAFHPNIKIFPIKVTSSHLKLEASHESIKRALRLVYKLSNYINVINLSSIREDLNFDEDELKIYEKLQEKKVIVVNAVGNEFKNITMSHLYPALWGNQLDNLIMVGASDLNNLTPTNYTNFDSNLVFVSSVGIVKALNNKGEYEIREGTSFASALVAAIVALSIDQAPKLLNKNNIKRLIYHNTRSFYHIPYKDKFTYVNGEIDITKLFNFLKNVRK